MVNDVELALLVLSQGADVPAGLKKPSMFCDGLPIITEPEDSAAAVIGIKIDPAKVGNGAAPIDVAADDHGSFGAGVILTS